MPEQNLNKPEPKLKCGNPDCKEEFKEFYRENFCSKECRDYCYDWEASCYEAGQTY